MAKDDVLELEGTVVEVISKGLIVYSNGFRVFIPASLSTVPRNGRLEEMLDKTVTFKVIEFDRRRGAVGSIRDAAREQNKAAQAKFWETAAVEDRFTGTVVSLTDFGAFVDLGGNVVGMIHRSELSWKRIKHPSEIVSIGYDQLLCRKVEINLFIGTEYQIGMKISQLSGILFPIRELSADLSDG